MEPLESLSHPFSLGHTERRRCRGVVGRHPRGRLVDILGDGPDERRGRESAGVITPSPVPSQSRAPYLSQHLCITQYICGPFEDRAVVP